MEPDNLELKEVKNEALEPEDQVDKSATKEEHVVLVNNEEGDDNVSKSSTESSAEETCNKMWEQAFEKLARADDDGNDGKIEVKSLVKWIKSLDLNSRVEYEKHLDISPNQIERIVNKVKKIGEYLLTFHFDKIFYVKSKW